MNCLDALGETLIKENEILDMLIDLSEQKQQCINDAQQIAHIAAQEQQYVSELEAVEKERAVLYDAVAPGQRVEQWIAQLDTGKEKFTELTTGLASKVAHLQTLNDLNRQLLQESLAFVQFTLNMLVDGDSAPTYARPGSSTQGKSTFERKV